MHQVSPDQRPKGKDIHTTLKFLVLFISIIPVLQKCIDFFSEDELVYFNIAKMIIFFVVITLAAVFWFIINYAFKNERVRLFFEVAVMYGVCLLCYISTGAATSSYKFIFALVIILYSINLGIRFGVGFSFVSGATIMIVDSLTIGEASRSHFFQADIILLGAFCMTAYTVGYYAEKDRKQIRALSDAVNRDSLTYLYNHRYFYDVMRKAIQNPPFGKKQYVMIMDIDYFKVYNDNLGHQKGDIALCRIAEISRSMFGDEFVFRYGGEEFAVYMLADDDNEAFINANELRTIVENFEFEGQYMQPGHNLTVSIGVAGRRDGGDTIADWIERADNALYKAKSFHRNRVQMYSSVFDRFDHLDQVSDDEQMISIKTLLSVINTRDRYTYNHTDRVVHFCEAYSKYAKLSEEQSRLLLHSAYLHDIGKINVPQEILISEKKLTDEEWALMKRHPLDGAEIVRKIHNMETVADIVEQHHEKYNGTGYPYGKKEDQLHVLARVLTLADSFDAMTAKRPYQKSKTFEEAFAEIRRCKGTQFDPELAEQFIEAIENSYF
jgi:diguanylate cyclase (GGDEF)-like protein/putative nucleotidyltransferase with HDIG domain